MRSVGIRGWRTRAYLVTGGATVMAACFAPQSTDFYEEPSAITGEGGSHTAGTSNAGAGASGGAAASAGSLEAGNGGSGSVAGAGGADAGTGSTGGVAAAAGSGAGARGGDAGTAGTLGEAGGGGAAPQVSCAAFGEDARDFDGHCYLFVDAELTWREAASACEELGAHLVTLSSDGRTREEFLEENRFVWELSGMTPAWIGAVDGKGPLEPGDGTYYTWLTDEPMTFDNWSPSQPNNSAAACQDDRPCSCDEGTCYEHCGFQWATAGKAAEVPGWNDRLCEHAIAYVCEWDDP